MKRTYMAEPEFLQDRVVMAAFNDGKRATAMRMTPEQAINLAAELQSAADRVMTYQASKEDAA